MTIKIECEVSDLSNAMDAAQERARQQLHQDFNKKVYLLETEKQCLQSEINVLKLQLEAASKTDYAPNVLPVNSLRELMSACFQGSKLSGIKCIRQLTACGLKDAKEFYEAVYEE